MSEETSKQEIENIYKKREITRKKLANLLICDRCHRRRDALLHSVRNEKICYSCAIKSDLKPNSKFKFGRRKNFK